MGLRQAVRSKPDVIVITGDLVHEGTTEDYATLRRILKREAGDIPVLPALGNHDFKSRFYQGYLEETRTGPYWSQAEIGGYRFCTLDTSKEGSPHGTITNDQTD